MTKVSVIIPVYNVEKYLRKCVDSVLNQTLDDLEIILVDDGSTDGSAKICDEYGKKTNVKVIHQKNAGASAARNAGIKVATGEYLGFVDSDDYIAEDMYSTLYQKSQEYDLDIVIGNYQTVKDGVKQGDGKICMPNERVVEQEEMRKVLTSKEAKTIIWFAVKSIFRRSLILDNQICFLHGMLGEDTLFNLDAMLYAESMYFIDRPLYFYEQSPNSQIRSSHKHNLLERLNILYKEKLSIYEKHGITDAKSIIAEYTLTHSVVMLLSNELHYRRKIRDKIKNYREIRNSEMVCDMFENTKCLQTRSRITVLIWLLKMKGYFLLALLTN